jgi:general secretion pathway protein G
MPTRFLGQAINQKQLIIVLPAIAGVLVLITLGCTNPAFRLKARETILKETLRTMRRTIDQYAADQRTLPSSLDDLVRKAYLREVPPDPITGRRDWNVDPGETLIGGATVRGIIDVHSNAPGKSSDGLSYRDY